MTLAKAARAARMRADTSIDPAVHRVACALESAENAARHRMHLHAMCEASRPETTPPPWSQVSRPDTSEGPLK
jgi:hypothetical protein